MYITFKYFGIDDNLDLILKQIFVIDLHKMKPMIDIPNPPQITIKMIDG